jgi:hypothetical protein
VLKSVHCEVGPRLAKAAEEFGPEESLATREESGPRAIVGVHPLELRLATLGHHVLPHPQVHGVSVADAEPVGEEPATDAEGLVDNSAERKGTLR